MSRHTRTFLSLVSVTAVLTGAQLLTAGAASAATPHCNWTSLVRSTWSGAGGDRAEIPSMADGNINCLLRRGDQGFGVGLLQDVLNKNWNAGLAVDLDFGPRTEAALKNAQSMMHITADGVYGPQTRNTICWPDYDKPWVCIWINNSH